MGQEVIGDFLQTHGITQEKFLWAHKILLSRAMTFYREGWDLNLGSHPFMTRLGISRSSIKVELEMIHEPHAPIQNPHLQKHMLGSHDITF